VKHIEADETWTFIQKKSLPGTDPELDLNPWGDIYIFFGLESETKLLLMPTIGKRTARNTERFAEELRRCTSGRFQLTTDGYRPYKAAIRNSLGARVDFAQFYKEQNMLNANNRWKEKDNSLKDSQHVYAVRCGSPQINRITTAHVERLNLSLRTNNRRFVRKGIGFSKDEEYLAHSVYLFAAYYNFCLPHSALDKKITPAMASGLADGVWLPEMILMNSL